MREDITPESLRASFERIARAANALLAAQGKVERLSRFRERAWARSSVEHRPSQMLALLTKR